MPNEKGVKIRFDIDDAPVKSALSKIDKEARKLQKSLKDIDKLLEMDPTNINLLTQKQAILAKSIDNTTSKLKAMEEAQDRITASNAKWKKVQEQLENNTEAIREMMDNLDGAQQKMEAIQASGLDENAEEYKKVAEEVKAYEQALKKLKDEQKALKNSQKNNIDDTTYQNYLITVESLRVNLSQLQQQEQSLSATMSAASQGANSLANNTEEEAQAAAQAAEEAERQAQAEAEKAAELKRVAEAEKAAADATEKYQNSLKELRDSTNKVKSDFSDIANVVTKGTAAIAGAVAAGAVASTKIGIDFTSEMSKVKAYSNATTQDMEKLAKAAREAGADTSKYSSEAAAALGYMSLAGWDTNEMLTSLMPILRASEAGEMDLATCSDLVTDSMSALGLTVNDLNRYLDIVSSAQSNSNTSMQQLLEAYIQCGGTLNNLNVGLEESASVLGVMANRGMKAEEAGRNLNSILVNLIGANSRAANAMEELGISAWDEQDNFIGLTNTITLLDDALSKSTAKQRALFEAAIGGKTQMDTLQAIIKGVRGEYSELNKTLENSQGALEKTAITMQDNLGGDITKLQSILQETGNEIFESLEEPFRDAAQDSIKSIKRLNGELDRGETSEKIKNIASSISELYKKSVDFAANDALPQVIEWLDWLADNTDAIISGIYGVGAAWATWKIGQMVIHLNDMRLKLIETVAAQKAMALASAGNSAALASETLTIKDYTAALTASKTAMLGLYAAAIALTAVLAKAIANKIDEASAALMAKNALDEETQAIYDQANAYNELMNERAEETNKIDENAQKSQELWKRITELTDAEGNAVGSVKDLENAVSEFNAISGQNIEIVNGQVQGYKDLKESMEDIIELDRKQAKLDYLQEGYTDAVGNVDKAREDVEKAKAEYEELRKVSQEARAKAKEEYDKAINEAGDGFIKIINFEAYNEAQAIADKALDAEAQASVRLGSLKQILNNYESTIEEYENIKYERDVSQSMTKEEAQRYAAEQEANRLAQIEKDKAEAIIKAREKTQEELEKELEDLDARLTKRKITDSDYWTEKANIIEKYRDEESLSWWEYFGELEDHNNSEIKEQIETLKEKQENNEEYTKEMLTDDIELLISGLDKESEIYKKYNQEIINSRKEMAKEASDAIKDGLDEDIDNIENSIKEVQNKYKSSMDSLLNEKDNYYRKLQSLTSLTVQTTQTDANGQSAEMFSLTDPEEALRKLDEWEKKTNEIKARGASDAVMAWVDGLDAKTAEQTIEVLSAMSDERLKEYSESFGKYQDKIQQMTDNKYKDKINELNTNFIQEVDALLQTLPDSAKVAGFDTVENFVNGLNEDTANLYDSVNEFTSSLLSKIRENLGINSPSKATEALGEYTADGFAVGMSEDKAAKVANDFVDSFINKLKEKDPEIQQALQDSFNTDVDLNINVIKSSIDALSSVASQFVPTLPTIPTVSAATSTASQESNNNTKIEQLVNAVNNLLSLITGKSTEEQKISLSVDISGQFTADSDELAAVVSKKINNISVMSGKGALIL